jgi:hypothetical protein
VHIILSSQALSKIMTLSSTGKVAVQPAFRAGQSGALSLPLLGVLPEEDWDLEQACELDDNRKHDHEHDHDRDCRTISYRELLILMLSALQLLELGWAHSYDSPDNSAQQVLPSMALGVALFCCAAILYKLSLSFFHPAVLIPNEGWLVNANFAVNISALIFQIGWSYYWLDNDAVLEGAFLFCVIVAISEELAFKKNPVALVPEIWMCAALATALLAPVKIAMYVLMVGAIVMSSAAAGFACWNIRFLHRKQGSARYYKT